MPRTWIGNFKGPKGDAGEQGLQGPQGPQGISGEKGDPGAVDENTPITFEVPEIYQTPESGNAIKVLFGKIAKGLSDLFAAVGVLASLKTVEKSTLVTAINELAEGKFDVAKIIASTNITEPGFVMDGKTASEALAELYSNTELVTGQLTNVEGTNGNIFGNTLKKCGNVVYLTLFISGIHISDQAPIATMPKDFAPKDKSAQVLGLAVINGETHAITFAINTSGIIFNSWTTSEITAAYIVGTYII